MKTGTIRLDPRVTLLGALRVAGEVGTLYPPMTVEADTAAERHRDAASGHSS